MNIIVPVVIVGGIVAAVASKFRGKDTTSPGVADERSYRFINGCTDLEVVDEARALGWVRKYVASLPAGPGWEGTAIREFVGGCLLQLATNKAAAAAVAQKHIGFLWKAALHAIRGAVDSGKITEAEAKGRIAAAIAQAQAQGVDAAVLQPQSLPS